MTTKRRTRKYAVQTKSLMRSPIITTLFIAANSVSDEIAFTTYNGQSWESIARQGIGEN